MFHVEQKFFKMNIKGNLIDLYLNEIYPVSITVKGKKIESICRIDEYCEYFILPGFIDAHIHIESSMLSPFEFGRQVIKHGTVAVVNDPHEIVNVCGLAGIEYMISDANTSPIKFFFGVPSCVPASDFETSGSHINADEISMLFKKGDFVVLSEMMNFPGVISQDQEVIRKIGVAQLFNKPVDGHAPGITGRELLSYVNAGITTDHECFSIKEAEEKVSLGMKILIREGSAAKNFDALFALIDKYPGKIMFCSDDKHPDDLVESHINNLVIRALAKGADLYNVLRAASHSPVLHYELPVGLLKEHDYADFIMVDNLTDFSVQKTIINGKIVFDKVSDSTKKSLKRNYSQINNFKVTHLIANALKTNIPQSARSMNVIEVIEDELITKSIQIPFTNLEEAIHEYDLNKIALVNRYIANSPPIIGYIKGFNVTGALASSVAHDSHNIIGVGNNDEDLLKAMNLVISSQGGLSFVKGNFFENLMLEIAGLMTNQKADEVAKRYKSLNSLVKENGCPLDAPFMTLSFMALIVIPGLKISDKGLFDISKLAYVPLFE